MKVGDLVKHSGKNDVVWYGIITKKSVFRTLPSGIRLLDTEYRFQVTWTFGVQGWFYSDDLEVVS